MTIEETPDPAADPELEALLRDMRATGVAFHKDGKRIDPRDVYLEPPEQWPLNAKDTR